MTASYASLDSIISRLGLVSTTSGDDARLQEALDWATSFIGGYTGRVFAESTATQYYRREDVDPRDYHVLYVGDDLLSVTTLVNGDGTTIPSSEYWLEPRNAPNEVPPGPYYAIRLKTTTSWVFPTDGWIGVTGWWAYSSEPDGLIVGCCLRLAEYFYRSKAPLETTTIFDGSIKKELPEGFPTEILTTLDQRKRLAP